jgi:hypothetical protein
MKPKFPNVKVKLVGESGNAFVIIGRVIHAMQKADVPSADIQAYRAKATCGDYDNLLRVTMEYVDAS